MGKAKSAKSFTLQAYQLAAAGTDQRRADGLGFPLLGLFGEVGSLLSEAKKKHRDEASYLGYEASVLEEFGDVLWYLAAVAQRCHLSLADIANNVGRSLSDWDTGPAPALSFTKLQAAPTSARAAPTPAYERTLLRLASEVGQLLAEHEAGRLEGNAAAISGRLVAIFRTLIQAANEAGISLERAALGNLAKIHDRWPEDRRFAEHFDAAFPIEERLPQQLQIEVFERSVAGSNYVFQRCNGINIGDRLTDNIMTPDDYRFHDVFHYAYAAVLGWSPVVRALFRLKRKSMPQFDEGQDGARAVLIEEGVSTWIFGQAKQLNFFADIQPNGLSLSLLKTVRQFVSGFEPHRCPLWMWEEAILQGYTAFRYLKQHRRGLVCLDGEARTLIVKELQT